MGTPDGLAVSDDGGLNWTIHRYWEATNQLVVCNMFYAYPNPFKINDYGHVRFVYSNISQQPSVIYIFDFAMDKIIHLNNYNAFTLEDDQNEIIWNGHNEYGEQVNNGIYFCRLTLNGEYYWTKLAVIN